MDRRQLTESIRISASELGFDLVGFSRISAVSSERLREWLARGYHGKMAYLERNQEKRLEPREILPSARSLVALGCNYFKAFDLPYDRPEIGVISRYASGTDYHIVIERKLRALVEKIKELREGVEAKVYVDTGPVLEKYWSNRSGLGWIGKHTNLISRQLGSWILLGEILLNLELEPDSPESDYCGSCTACIEACPTDAIVEPYVLDSRRCISYLTIELRDDIPSELRSRLRNLIFGCDICQDVCPWNRKAPEAVSGDLGQTDPSRSLKQLARMTPEEFRDEFRKSPVKRTKWGGLMRNVAVAIGNGRDAGLIPELVSLLNSGNAIVRRHAAWALAQIGIEDAILALRERAVIESDEETLSLLRELVGS